MNDAEMTIPILFRCPISLDLFTDPVTLCTGQTYERSSIEKWLSTGNLTCPVTMQRLHDLSVVPNHTLRHHIDQWLQTGGDDHHYDPDQYLTTVDPDRSLSALKHNLESNESSLDKKLETLERVCVVFDESPWRMSCLIQLGFLPLLLKLVFQNPEGKFSQENLNFAEKALSCVIKLVPLGKLECLNVLKEESKLSSFLVLNKQGNAKISIGLCQLVEAISSALETKELFAILGRNREILHSIILLLQQNSEASGASLKAISALCKLELNRENLVREGAVDGLISYILSWDRSERSLAPIAMGSMEVLLGVESAKVALVNNPNGINVLVKMVFRVSDHQGSESAVNSLMIVCCDSLRAQEEAICAGVLTQLLWLLQSQCNGRTKTRARMLLQLLRSTWAEKPKNVLNSE